MNALFRAGSEWLRYKWFQRLIVIAIFKEDTMLKSTQVSLIVVTAAIGFAFASPSHASSNASLFKSCQADSRSAVESCCHAWIRDNGTPIWMDSRDSCQQVVSCGAGLSKGRRCVVEIVIPENGTNVPAGRPNLKR
jgi:hypothetical protein